MAEESTAIAMKSAEVETFELMQRKAATFARSPLVPDHIRGKTDTEEAKKQGIANCYICLVLAEQMNENPLVVMQNIYIVHGKPGWSASYMIAKANASGIFKGVIRFKHEGSGASRKCTASATLKDTGEVVEVCMSMETATAEGWTKNSKYRSMPDQMLAYRAATLLVRLYCPQVMLGYHTADELADVAAADQKQRLTISQVIASDDEIDDAEIETKTAEAAAVTVPPPGDKLTELIKDFDARGGDWPAFLSEHNAMIEDVMGSKNKARSEWCTRLNGAIQKLERKDG